MALFRKRKDEEEEEDYEEDEEEEEPRRPLKKKFPGRREFKDLNPSDKRNRKEPPKPWGKKERLLILFLILMTAGTSGFLALSSRDWKLPGLPRLKLPAFTLPVFFGEETIVLEGNRKAINKEKEAVSAFEAKTKSLSGVYGLYVLRFEDSSGFGINEKEIFQAASLIKLPLMAAMYKEAEAGKVNLETRYKLKNSDKIGGSGSLYSKPAGYEITYRNLIKLMGKESDNTAFNIIRKFLGDEKIAEIINSIGMNKTSLQENETTPQDIGIFFAELWEGNIVNEKNKSELLSFLTDTLYEKWLRAGIPENVRVAHKFGRELHVVNDAGIVFSDSPFVLVLMSKGIVESEADSIIPELSGIIYGIETAE